MITCAIVGVTGLVGSTFLKVLEEKKLPIDKYVFFASERSEGKKITFMNQEYIVKKLDETSFNENFTYALFSAGGSISEKYASIAANTGTVVIDNSSFWRMHKDVALIIPEVNYDDIAKYSNNIIANPNCSTIQALVAIAPLYRTYGIKRIIYSTYQAVSGAGQKGISDLQNTYNGKTPQKFIYSITNNCLPHIDSFLDNGYTKEEEKMISETKKILNDDSLNITATCVRVPVLNCHSESINIELNKSFDIMDVKRLLANSDGIALLDDIDKNIYPINTFVNNKDEVFVGRIRRDYSVENGINMWVVADNVRKGAATNAVQILERLIKEKI